jgi:hypothetical protein
MADKTQDGELDEKPLDPSVERVRRKLVRFVAINAGILMFALMAVVLALVYQATRSPDVPAPAGPDRLVSGDILLPAGARVLSHSLSGARLSLHLALEGGAEAILIYDVGQARPVGRFSLRTE